MKCVDLFAGWGGFTAGATKAGAEVVWAANHWPLAVEAHAANHPNTKHVCQDLRQADWTALPRYDVLLASPACQGHSTASQPGRRRHHDALRATAYAVLDCAGATLPEAFVVENVPSFKTWGPGETRNGELYRHWCKGFEILGYTLSETVLRASHFGVPQRRDRLFILGTRRGKPPRLKPLTPNEVPFGPCIDRGHSKGWRSVAKATARIKERIAKGRRNHGDVFLTQHVTGHPGVSLDEPIRTITTKSQWNLVMGDRYRPLTVREHARGMGFDDTYNWPDKATKADCIKGLGNAVCPPLAQAIIQELL